MAKVFFGRRGNDRNRASVAIEADVTMLASKLSKYKVRHSAQPPLVNENEKVSQYSTYTLTVARIDGDEACAKFPGEGYYLFEDLSPEVCCSILGIQMPQR